MRHRIQPHEIAMRAVVGGVEDLLVGRIPDERGHRVDERPLDVDEPLERAGLRRNPADVRDRARIVETGIKGVGTRIVERARNRPERAWRDIAIRRERILPDRLEVPSLERVFVGDPRGPGLLERYDRTPAGTASRSTRGSRRAATSTRSVSPASSVAPATS